MQEENNREDNINQEEVQDLKMEFNGLINDNNINDWKEISKNISKYNLDIAEKFKKNVLPSIFRFYKTITEVVSTRFMESFVESIRTFHNALEQAKKNPDSLINHYNYLNKLDSFYWAWPYDIKADELKKLIEQAENEKSFDKIMISFFSKERIDDMMEDIYISLPRKHKMLFRQIRDAVNNKQYALANNGIISIIDNMPIMLLKNKGKSRRKGILEPIIDFYVNEYKASCFEFVFELKILSNNLNLLFEDYSFNEKIMLDTNKKVRRHINIHGFAYSNKKEDTIMLLNTLYAYLKNIEYINVFKNSLVVEKKSKKFVIETKDYVIKNRIRKSLSF